MGLAAAFSAAAATQLEEFNYGKFSLAPGISVNYLDRFDSAGPLDNPGAAFEWQKLYGEFLSADEAAGSLTLDPWIRGQLLSIGGQPLLGQAMWLRTPGSGDAAITNQPGTIFLTRAIYKDPPTMSWENTYYGTALANVFDGGDRAFALTVGEDDRGRYAKFSNPFTGDIYDWQPLAPPPGTAYLSLDIFRETPDSNFIGGGVVYLNATFGFLGNVRVGSVEAFSDVVLYPVVFAATLVPEPETWATLLVGLGLVGARLLTQQRREARSS
jgi:hypothetical protein